MKEKVTRLIFGFPFPGPGDLDHRRVKTDSEGCAETTYQSAECGAATITAGWEPDNPERCPRIETRTDLSVTGCDSWDATISYTEQLTLKQHEKWQDEIAHYEQLKEKRRTYAVTVKAQLSRNPKSIPEKVKEAFEKMGLGTPNLDFDTKWASVTLSDVYSGHYQYTVTRRDGHKVETEQRCFWSGSSDGTVPLSLLLSLRLLTGEYVTGFGDFDYGATAQDLTFPYTYRASCRHIPPQSSDFNCQGTARVDQSEAIPFNIFVNVPEEMFNFQKGQTVLRGSHSWVEDSSEIHGTDPWNAPPGNPQCNTYELTLCDLPPSNADGNSKLEWTFRKTGNR